MQLDTRGLAVVKAAYLIDLLARIVNRAAFQGWFGIEQLAFGAPGRSCEAGFSAGCRKLAIWQISRPGRPTMDELTGGL